MKHTAYTFMRTACAVFSLEPLTPRRLMALVADYSEDAPTVTVMAYPGSFPVPGVNEISVMRYVAERVTPEMRLERFGY